MRENTDPCSLCEYCDDSCKVCMHQPYENSNWAYYYCEPSSCDESERGNASTDVDSDSDEDGSWFTTPWSKLIAQRVAGYEIDPEIGVQLTPIEHPEEEEEEKQNRDEKEKNENRQKRRHRRRRKKRKNSTAEIAGSVVESASSEERTEPESTAQPANGVEQVEYIEPASEPAKNEVQHGKEPMPKTVHDNTWSESVQASVSQVTVS